MPDATPVAARSDATPVAAFCRTLQRHAGGRCSTPRRWPPPAACPTPRRWPHTTPVAARPVATPVAASSVATKVAARFNATPVILTTPVVCCAMRLINSLFFFTVRLRALYDGWRDH
uniref:Uncharacterized protein n=1 Tax=Knipowitschia caucasica TaxID=637954 RepID=A0AAV2KUK8_KNICA